MVRIIRIDPRTKAVRSQPETESKKSVKQDIAMLNAL